MRFPPKTWNAAQFYEMLLSGKLRRESFGEPYVLFPSSQTGMGGGLVQREFQRPSDGRGIGLSKQSKR